MRARDSVATGPIHRRVILELECSLGLRQWLATEFSRRTSAGVPAQDVFFILALQGPAHGGSADGDHVGPNSAACKEQRSSELPAFPHPPTNGAPQNFENNHEYLVLVPAIRTAGPSLSLGRNATIQSPSNLVSLSVSPAMSSSPARARMSRSCSSSSVSSSLTRDALRS
jgi:hypothetical protein